MSKKIVFFGNERLATGVTTTCPTLQALIAAGYEIAALVSSFERAQSRNARDDVKSDRAASVLHSAALNLQLLLQISA